MATAEGEVRDNANRLVHARNARNAGLAQLSRQLQRMEEQRLGTLSRLMCRMSDANVTLLSVASSAHRMASDKIMSADPQSDIRMFVHKHRVDLTLVEAGKVCGCACVGMCVFPSACFLHASVHACRKLLECKSPVTRGTGWMWCPWLPRGTSRRPSPQSTLERRRKWGRWSPLGSTHCFRTKDGKSTTPPPSSLRGRPPRLPPRRHSRPPTSPSP